MMTKRLKQNNQNGERKKSEAKEKLELMKKLVAENNMHEVSKILGSEEDYLQNGPHWSGKWDIGPYMASLEQAANSSNEE